MSTSKMMTEEIRSLSINPDYREVAGRNLQRRQVRNSLETKGANFSGFRKRIKATNWYPFRNNLLPVLLDSTTLRNSTSCKSSKYRPPDVI